MGDDLSFFLIGIAVAFLIALQLYLQSEGHKKRIIRELQLRGATDITLSIQWFDFDKTTSTYDVIYRDRQGQRRQISCKVQTGLFSDNQIYWRDPL